VGEKAAPDAMIVKRLGRSSIRLFPPVRQTKADKWETGQGSHSPVPWMDRSRGQAPADLYYKDEGYIDLSEFGEAVLTNGRAWCAILLAPPYRRA
jgi:hypothetical protein